LQKEDEAKKFKQIKEILGPTIIPLILILIAVFLLLLVVHSYFEKDDEED